MDLESVTWIFERGVLGPDGIDVLREAAEAMGFPVLRLDDRWISGEVPPPEIMGPVVFRGCLQNAATIRERRLWKPGPYCDTANFACSRWYPGAHRWLLHGSSWQLTTARQLVENPAAVLGAMGNPARFFVRPDSPLKPFSGRVVEASKISWDSIDYGFYYEDKELPVIVAPERTITREFRYVVARNDDLPCWRWVVSGWEYNPHCRLSAPAAHLRTSEVHGWESLGFAGSLWLAQEIAGSMNLPEDVVVVDICESDGQFWLMEINPFSGAELLGCDPTAVVRAVSLAATRYSG